MEQVNYADKLALRPSEKDYRWMREQIKPEEYLIYRDHRQTQVEIRCTICKSVVTARKYYKGEVCNPRYQIAPFGFFYPNENEMPITTGESYPCPVCKGMATAKHVGEMRDAIDKEWYFMTIGRLDEKLVLYGWIVQRHVNKSAEDYWSVKPYEAYVVEKKKLVRIKGYNKYIYGISLHPDKWEQMKVANYDNWGSSEIAPWNPSLLEGSTAENSKLDLYIKCAKEPNPVSYIKLWQKHPQIENLIVQGMGSLVGEFIAEERRTKVMSGYDMCYSAKPFVQLKFINWKEKRPAAMLRMTKPEFDEIRKSRWNVDMYKKYITAKKQKITLADVPLLKKADYHDIDMFIDKYAGISLMRCLRYLDKQSGRKTTFKFPLSLRYLTDYWRMAAECGKSLDDPSVRYPKDVIRAHDKYDQEIKERKKAQAREALEQQWAASAPAFLKRYAELIKFEFEKNGILIRPCRSEKELYNEGEKLSHCVGGYTEEHLTGNPIFFARRSDKADEPWYTVQLDIKKLEIRQNLGKRNCAPTEDVKKVTDDWIAWLKSGEWKKIKKEATAA